MFLEMGGGGPIEKHKVRFLPGLLISAALISSSNCIISELGDCLTDGQKTMLTDS